jgi:DNA invertase Pin-like site-specific DNA recombinase
MTATTAMTMTSGDLALHKVTSRHRQRLAYLYVRQSTVRQVLENTESTARQYALRERAVALGWQREQVITIDCDLGQSGASAVDRAGFQRLVSEVGLARVGLVLGLEVSRLARSSADWHHLLELCAMTGTLILDEDGLYDPTTFNDRLLLGLKGAMSEAELHILQARLLGGIRNKARRGALKLALPVGLVYAEDNRVVLDPDAQIQATVRHFFETFRRSGSVWQTVRTYREQQLKFPKRLRRGPHLGEVVWTPLDYHTALGLLHNPRYAGAFVFGRTHTYKTADGRTHIDDLPRADWDTLLQGAHVGYITWDEYEENLARLKANRQAYGPERRLNPAREGPALLQGVALCGVCGERMTVRYHNRKGRAVPDYVCQRASVDKSGPVCQRIPGRDLDVAIGDVLIATVTPLALELALAVHDEITARAEQADQLRQQEVARAEYEAQLAQRRFFRVDPDNRLVADALEADWNAKLRAVAETREALERQRQKDRHILDPQQRAEIAGLATDFRRLWQDPATPDRERKRLVRLLIEDVTLLKSEVITAHIRFKGGATQSLTVALPIPLPEQRRTKPKLIQQIDRLLDEHTDGEVAELLNAEGRRTLDGTAFTGNRIYQLRQAYDLPSRYARLRAAGMLTADEAVRAYGVTRPTLHRWCREGRLQAWTFNDKGERLFAHPDELAPHKWARK